MPTATKPKPRTDDKRKPPPGLQTRDGKRR